MRAALARALAWFRRVVRGRCLSTFQTAFDEELRCELPRGHRVAHRATVRTSLDRTYLYEWTYPWDFDARRPSKRR